MTSHVGIGIMLWRRISITIKTSSVNQLLTSECRNILKPHSTASGNFHISPILDLIPSSRMRTLALAQPWKPQATSRMRQWSEWRGFHWLRPQPAELGYDLMFFTCQSDQSNHIGCLLLPVLNQPVSTRQH